MFKSRQRSTPEDGQVNAWEAFEAEAMPHLGNLFRIAMWRVRNRSEAEDLVRETLAEALQSFHRFQSGTNCRAWLVTIMFHLDSKRRRKNSRLQLVSDAEDRIAETVAFESPTRQGISDEKVLRALERIPPNFSHVVLLADVEDMSYKEIAEALQVPMGTVMSRLNRGRKLLRAELTLYADAHGIGHGSAGEAASTPTPQ